VKVFNIGSGVETSVNELAKKLINFFDPQIKPIYLNPKAGDIRRSCADVSKAKRFFGFKATVSLDSGLNMLVKELV
jgi:UDP-glucose 4-epimerase